MCEKVRQRAVTCNDSLSDELRLVQFSLVMLDLSPDINTTDRGNVALHNSISIKALFSAAGEVRSYDSGILCRFIDLRCIWQIRIIGRSVAMISQSVFYGPSAPKWHCDACVCVDDDDILSLWDTALNNTCGQRYLQDKQLSHNNRPSASGSHGAAFILLQLIRPL